MDGAEFEKALERIEAALARIEQAADRPAQAAARIEARHEQLKDAVAQSLRQLDDLLAGHQA
ncbi:MAG: hypothetical protein IT550_10890 [Novosphingobium sp.]|nr:hypothetical protein [Novosphingobium sp.]